MSGDVYDYPEEVTQIGYHIWVGTLSLQFYDYLLTLDDEIELFWKRRWTIATFLVLWTRYGGIVLMITYISLFTSASNPQTACQIWFIVRVVLGIINTWAVEVSLLLRLYALYNCSRRIAYIAGSIFFVQIMIVIGISAFMTRFALQSLDPDILHSFVYCETDDPRATSLSWVYWGSFAFLQAFIFLLTIRRAYELYRHQRKPTAIRLTNLVSTLLWDSISYTFLIGMTYASIIVIESVNASSHVKSIRGDLKWKNSNMLSGLGHVLPIIMGGRMMINVRKAVAGRHPSTPSQISVHMVDMNDESSVLQWTYTYI